jgi:hypothetical protein
MASLGNLLSGALGGEYSMGRGLDEEERRLIEELRAQGAYVPQERKVSPFRYGAGTVSKRNLADIRGAIKPEQQRRMSELMVQRGRGSRDALAMEQQQRRQQVDDAIRQRNIATELKRRQLGGMPTTSGAERFRKSTAFGEQPMISEEDFIAGSAPQITMREQAELAVLQRESLPTSIQEQNLKAQEIANKVGIANLEELQSVTELAQGVRAALPPDYVQTLADKRVVSDELAVLIGKHRLDLERKYGARLAELGVNKQEQTIKLELLALDTTLKWLQTTEGQTFQAAGGMYELNIQKLIAQLKQLEAAASAEKSRGGYYDRGGRALTNGPGGSGLRDALGDDLHRTFNLNPAPTSGTID